MMRSDFQNNIINGKSFKELVWQAAFMHGVEREDLKLLDMDIEDHDSVKRAKDRISKIENEIDRIESMSEDEFVEQNKLDAKNMHSNHIDVWLDSEEEKYRARASGLKVLTTISGTVLPSDRHKGMFKFITEQCTDLISRTRPRLDNSSINDYIQSKEETISSLYKDLNFHKEYMDNVLKSLKERKEFLQGVVGMVGRPQ